MGLISLLSRGLSRSSSSSQFESTSSSAFFTVQLSHPYVTSGKTIALIIWTFVCKVMSLLFNTLSRFVIAFLPRSSCLYFMAAVTIQSDFRPQEEEICYCFHLFPFCLPWTDGSGCHDLSFLILSFKLAFSLSSFTLIKRLFSSSSLSAFRVVSSTYWGCWYFFWQSWFRLATHPAWHFTWYALHKS